VRARAISAILDAGRVSLTPRSRSSPPDGRKIGLCGQAPSDYPEFAEFLVECGIDSMSLNPDAVVPTLRRVAAAEERLAEREAAVGAREG
jgi:phosphoenolpyruvate-protein kinase (PTS system EI component)